MIMLSTKWKFFVLGIPTWSMVNATWVLLSELARVLPEGYNISAYLVVSLTLANVFPLGFGYLLYSLDDHALRQVIIIMNTIGFVAGILLSFVWDWEFSIGSNFHLSLPLLFIFFIISAVSASSTVADWKFVAEFSSTCTTYLATGMGLGTLSAALTTLVMSTFATDRTVVRLVLIVVSFFYVPAILFMPTPEEEKHGYQIIQNTDDYEEAQEDRTHSSTNTDNVTNTDLQPVPILLEDYNRKLGSGSSADCSSDNGYGHRSKEGDSEVKHTEAWFIRKYLNILILQGLASGLGHGLVPSLVSTVCGRFQNAHTTLSLATGLSAVMDPMCRFLTDFYHTPNVAGIAVNTSVLVMLSLLMVLLAVVPTSAAIFSLAWGGVVPVLTHVSFISLFVFTNTSVFLVLKGLIPDSCIGHAYKWSALSVQIGAVIGTVISFTFLLLGLL